MALMFPALNLKSKDFFLDIVSLISQLDRYGMFHGRPCIMVKLNKVFGWEPEPFYNITEVGYQ